MIILYVVYFALFVIWTNYYIWILLHIVDTAIYNALYGRNRRLAFKVDLKMKVSFVFFLPLSIPLVFALMLLRVNKE